MKRTVLGMAVFVCGLLLQAQSINVIFPKGGEEFSSGASLKIRWAAPRADGDVQIDLYNAAENQKIKIIVVGVPASRQEYSFSLAGLQPGKYYILITMKGGMGKSGVFSVADLKTVRLAQQGGDSALSRPPVSPALLSTTALIWVILPKNNHIIMDNTTGVIEWRTKGMMQNRVRIDAIWTKPGQPDVVFAIAKDVANSGSYAWKTATMGKSNETFRIRVTTMDGRVTGLGNPFFLASYSLLEKVRQEFLVLINQHRQKNGKGPLQLDACINRAAQKHSLWMHNTGTFSHTGKNGSDHQARCNAAGCTCSAENIQAGAGTAQAVLESWRNSPGHNATMLGDFTRIGLGKAGSWWTTDFL